MAEPVGKIYLTFDEELEEEIKQEMDSFSVGISPFIEDDYAIDLILHKDANVKEKLILDDEKINILLENRSLQEFALDDDESMESRVIEIIDDIIDGNIDMFSTAKRIQINSSNYELILDFLKHNPELKNMQVILGTSMDLDRTIIEQIKNVFKDYSNIYILLEGNNHPVVLKDCNFTVNRVDEIVEQVRQHNFSPFEQIMYTYDLVRDREYLSEEDGESYSVSRDLTSILMGDKIVCAGFANLFDIILKKLGHHTCLYKIDGIEEQPGHARNLVHVQDEKYHVDGLYFFDATWDCKKNGDNEFLNSYHYFATTKKAIDFYTRIYPLEDTNLPDSAFNITNAFTNLVENGNTEEALMRYSKFINRLGTYSNNEKLHVPRGEVFRYLSMQNNIDCNEIIENLKNAEILLHKQIYANTFLDLLYHVRKVEYLENPEKYKFSLENMHEITRNSNWIFNQMMERVVLKLTYPDMSNKELDEQLFRNGFSSYAVSTDLEGKIEDAKKNTSQKEVQKQKKL